MHSFSPKEVAVGVAFFLLASNVRISVVSVHDVTQNVQQKQIDFDAPNWENVRIDKHSLEPVTSVEESPPQDGLPFVENLGEYASLTPEEWELRSRIHRLDLIKEPFDPTIPRISSVKADSPYSYAMICWSSDPDEGPYPGYKPYLANMLVARKILLEQGSKADFNVVFKIKYTSNATRLPEQDHKSLKAMGIKVSYLPKTPDGANFFVDQFNKFELWNMTQYRRILYLDGDVMPINNLDYLFKMSDRKKPILKPNMLLAGHTEPSNGGFFMFQPNSTAYRELRQIILNLGPEAGRGTQFPNRSGLFGHVITPPDKWETNKGHLQGTEFTFVSA
jgi:hypothetical protein